MFRVKATGSCGGAHRWRGEGKCGHGPTGCREPFPHSVRRIDGSLPRLSPLPVVRQRVFHDEFRQSIDSLGSDVEAGAGLIGRTGDPRHLQRTTEECNYTSEESAEHCTACRVCGPARRTSSPRSARPYDSTRADRPRCGNLRPRRQERFSRRRRNPRACRGSATWALPGSKVPANVTLRSQRGGSRGGLPRSCDPDTSHLAVCRRERRMPSRRSSSEPRVKRNAPARLVARPYTGVGCQGCRRSQTATGTTAALPVTGHTDRSQAAGERRVKWLPS